MMFLRIVTGIREHFDARVIEWGMGSFILYYGFGLAGPANGWTVPAAWAGMLQYLPENGWGLVCIALGVARLLALGINGTFAGTIYSRFSPTVRGICAIASATFWFMVILSVSAVPSIGSRTYLLPLAFEIWCVSRAWRDNGHEGQRARAKGGVAG